MHVYRICNSTHYINAHHTIVYTYLYNYIGKDIHQPLSTITDHEVSWDVSIPGLKLILRAKTQVCLWHFTIYTSEVSGPVVFFRSEKLEIFWTPWGQMPVFTWLHQQTIIQYLDGDEVEIAGNYCPSHRCTVPVPIILWPSWSGHAPVSHIALAVAAAVDVVVAVDVAAATAVAFAFVALT